MRQTLHRFGTNLGGHVTVILFEFESEYFDLEAEEGQCRESIVSFLELNNYEFFMNHPEHRFLPALSLTSYFHGDIVAVPRAVN